MIDKTSAMNVFQITEEEYDELLSDFIEQANQKIQNIESALKNNDIPVLAREIHAMKGVAGNMRLNDCYETIVSIETALKAGNNALVKSGVSGFRDCIEEIRLSVKR
jgi:HPt (histidine-containing phosphotransfer) domain-containing protein